ncbi:MAG: glycosyl hydrolase family 28 protein, partial [Bryobacteraceae bacterium]
MPSRAILLFVPLLAAAIAPMKAKPAADPARSKDGGLTIWKAPAGEKLYSDYTVRLNGKEVPVYSCRVSAMPFNQVWPGYQRPLDQTELAGFATWGMARAVKVEVRVKRPFQTVAVRPTSRGIHPAVKGRTITFVLPRPGQYTVELDGPHHALHLFANPPETDAPTAGDPNVLYFGPGVHRPGKILLKSGQTVYIAGGAVVYTAINGKDVSGVRILGRGIVDTSEFERDQGPGSIRFLNSSDVKVEGLILRDPDLWCLTAFGSRRVDISNVKLIGLWRYNSDGIDICNSEDVTIRDSFVRAFDDSIVLKGMGAGGELYGQPYTDRPVRNVRASGLVV